MAGLKRASRGIGVGLSAIAVLCLSLVATGLPVAMSARAEAPPPVILKTLSGPSHAESTYLSLTREKMRRQLAANDLDRAAQTLQWIRNIDPNDAVTNVLAIELQLRRGNVAAAAMRLIDILGGAPATDAGRAEARRILALLEAEGTGAAVMVTRAMLDAATLPEAPGPLLVTAVDDGFAYEVGDLPGGGDEISAQILAFATTTPLDQMRATATTTIGAAARNGTESLQLASAVAPVPSVPARGQSRELIDLVFVDPTNLQLNFALFQEQLASGDLDGAMVTLERVLIVDPESKLAKVLLADVNLQKGNLPMARNILSTLLAEEDTPIDMARRAEVLLAEVESQLDPMKMQARLAMEMGQTENAFGRSKSDEILFLNLPITNTTPDKSDPYLSYQASVKVLRELDRQTPTLLEAGVSVTGRDTRHRSLSDIRTVSANLAVSELSRTSLSGGLFASTSRVNNRSFNSNMGVFVAVSRPMAPGWNLTQSLSASRTRYGSYPGVADNRDRTDRSGAAKLDLSREFERAVVSLALSVGRAKARNRIHSLRFQKMDMAVAGMLGDLSVTGSLSRQWTRKDAADTLVSPLRPKLRQDVRSLKLRYPPQETVGGLPVSPYLRVMSRSTKSNIVNHRREGAEAAIGIESVF